MKLSDLAGILPVDGAQLGDLAITGISSDRGRSEPGMLFVAVAGTQGRRRRLMPPTPSSAAPPPSSRRRAPIAAHLSVPVIEVDDPRRALALSPRGSSAASRRRWSR